MSEGFTSPPTFPAAFGNGSNTAVVGDVPPAGKSTTDVAKQEAGNVASGVAEAGQQVAATVKDQAKSVTDEAGKQAKDLLNQAQSELGEQAAVQQERVAAGLRSVAQELHSMAAGSSEPGMATDLANQAGDKAQQVAQWLDNRDPGALLDEVRAFARQRPGTYLALALGAGVLAGRLSRGLTAHRDDHETDHGAARESDVPAIHPVPLTPELATGVTAGFGIADLPNPPGSATPTYSTPGFDLLRGDGIS
jgi:hypothetical protein